MLLKIILGSRNPKKSNLIEVHFGKSVFTVQKKQTPTSLFFAENSKNPIRLTIDRGQITLTGTIEIYKKTKFTQMAPLWVEFGKKAIEIIKTKGKVELELSVPEGENRIAVALLKLKHSN